MRIKKAKLVNASPLLKINKLDQAIGSVKG